MGTKATFVISAQSFTLEGDYEIRWSETSSFTGGTYTVLDSGSSPRGTYTITKSVTIPESKYGIHYIQYMRIYHNDPINVQFIVRPKLSVSPSQATPGTRVTLKGTGFPARDTGSITFDDNTTVVKFTSNKLGSFSTSMKVPYTSAGSHTLTAESPSLYTITTDSLKVLEEPKPEPAPEPEPVVEDPIPEPAPEPEPESEVDITEDVICPPSPSPVTPMGQKFGIFGPQSVTFFWNPVADENGVTYTLEISDNTEFTQIQPGLSKKSIQQTSYTVTLEPGIYYWRVQATDGYGNKSQWGNAPYGFTVAELSIAIRDFLAFWKRTL